MLGLMPAGEAVEEARAAAADGIRAFQIKVSGEPPGDAEVVAAVRSALGADVALRVDVNQGYARFPLGRAIELVRELVAAGADLVEQPVEGLDAMAAVAAAVDAPIVADESCWTSADAVEVARRGAADALSVYVAKAGALREARRVAEVAEAHNMPCDVNGSLESGIGTLASVHLAAASPAITLPAVISCPAPAGTVERAAGRYYDDDVLEDPLRFEEGCLIVPDGPGLGVSIDEDAVRRLSVEDG
jgi:muconate cycloisomerase